MGAAEEIRRAGLKLRRAYRRASGTNWSVAVEKTPEDDLVIGVVDENDELVMGDCVGNSENWIQDEDAEFIALMDPAFAKTVVDLLDIAEYGIDRLGESNPLIEKIAGIARKINEEKK